VVIYITHNSKIFSCLSSRTAGHKTNTTKYVFYFWGCFMSAVKISNPKATTLCNIVSLASAVAAGVILFSGVIYE
jgi:hypothetical protein